MNVGSLYKISLTEPVLKEIPKKKKKGIPKEVTINGSRWLEEQFIKQNKLHPAQSQAKPGLKISK